MLRRCRSVGIGACSSPVDEVQRTIRGIPAPAGGQSRLSCATAEPAECARLALNDDSNQGTANPERYIGRAVLRSRASRFARCLTAMHFTPIQTAQQYDRRRI